MVPLTVLNIDRRASSRGVEIGRGAFGKVLLIPCQPPYVVKRIYPQSDTKSEKIPLQLRLIAKERMLQWQLD